MHTLPHTPRTRTVAVVGPLLALVLIATACGSDGSSDTNSAAPSSTNATSSDGIYGGTTGTTAASGTSSGAAGVSTGATVAVSSDSNLGQILVDNDGRTLYLFEKDTGTDSTCDNACAAAWPPLTTTGQPQAGDAAQQPLLGTSSRNDGSTQVTYDGHPLYYYQGDRQPGDVNGQGLDAFGAEWYVVSPSGQKVEEGGS